MPSSKELVVYLGQGKIMLFTTQFHKEEVKLAGKNFIASISKPSHGNMRASRCEEEYSRLKEQQASGPLGGLVEKQQELRAGQRMKKRKAEEIPCKGLSAKVVQKCPLYSSVKER